MSVLLQKRISNRILWATINRPKARNAIDFEVMDELENLVDQVKKEGEIRVLILSGAGDKSFIAGGDLKKFHSIKDEETAIKMAKRMQKILSEIEALPCWTVAFVNGDAYGGGIETMLAFDFRLAVAHAKFGFTQGRFNLVPGWGGLTRLVEKVGRSKALQWLGKAEIHTATYMKETGLVDEIITGENAEQEVLVWVEAFCKNDRDFISTLKKGALRVSKYRQEALKAEIKPFAKLWVNEEHLRRVKDFISDRE